MPRWVGALAAARSHAQLHHIVSARPAARPLQAHLPEESPCPRCGELERELRVAIAAAAAAEAAEAIAKRQLAILASLLPDAPGAKADDRPLRYRMVDRLNAIVKSAPVLHATMKRAALAARAVAQRGQRR